MYFRNDAFPLDKCQYLATYLLKLINKCYWNCTESDGCMSADENELSESCLETLTVIFIFILCVTNKKMLKYSHIIGNDDSTGCTQIL